MKYSIFSTQHIDHKQYASHNIQNTILALNIQNEICITQYAENSIQNTIFSSQITAHNMQHTTYIQKYLALYIKNKICSTQWIIAKLSPSPS